MSHPEAVVFESPYSLPLAVRWQLARVVRSTRASGAASEALAA